MALFGFLKKTAKSWFQKAQHIEQDGAKRLAEEALKYAADFGRGTPAKWDEQSRQAKINERRKQINECIDNALELDSSFAPALLAKGELCTAYSYSTSGGLNNVKFTFSDEAIGFFDRCLSASPKMPDANYYRARIHECKKEYDDALTYYEKAISLNTSDSESWHGKSRVLAVLGKSEESKECEEKAKKLKALSVGYRWLYLIV